ncbi:MAG: hypothetical protein JEY71_14165 [Sphaerochaeta sp.]|nr:hypothetical protein [Sphaerochaeta sp.]
MSYSQTSLVVAMGLGFFGSADETVDAVVTNKTYELDREAKKRYDCDYAVFKALYKSNRNHFIKLTWQ